MSQRTIAEVPSYARIDRRKPRDQFVDQAKGLAIILVVFGHLPGHGRPAGNDWYNIAYFAIYLFHMPFFMFLSGYVFSISSAAEKAEANFSGYLRSRAERLLIPFFVLGMIGLVTKFATSFFIHVPGAASRFTDGLRDVFVTTDHTDVVFIWYVFALFIFSVITPPLLKLGRGNLWILLAASLAIYIAPVPPMLYLDRASDTYIFFILGLVAHSHQDTFKALTAMPLLWLPPFAGLIALSLTLPEPASLMATLLTGIIAIPAISSIVLQDFVLRNKIMGILGAYAFTIYLFNTFFVAAARITMQQLVSWDGVNFVFYVPILMVAGIVGPMVLKRYVLQRFPHIDKMTS